jgi:outer membrane protein W
MLRKSILALAALGALGTAALTPTTASAHWYGSGWYGYGKPYYGYGWNYRPYGFYGQRYFYGGKFAGRKFYRSY